PRRDRTADQHRSDDQFLRAHRRRRSGRLGSRSGSGHRAVNHQDPERVDAGMSARGYLWMVAAMVVIGAIVVLLVPVLLGIVSIITGAVAVLLLLLWWLQRPRGG